MNPPAPPARSNTNSCHVGMKHHLGGGGRRGEGLIDEAFGKPSSLKKTEYDVKHIDVVIEVSVQTREKAKRNLNVVLTTEIVNFLPRTSKTSNILDVILCNGKARYIFLAVLYGTVQFINSVAPNNDMLSQIF